MRISKIVFTVEPYHQALLMHFGSASKYIELHCTLSIDGEELHWKEIVEERDFESRFDHYIDYMKEQFKAKIMAKLLEE